MMKFYQLKVKLPFKKRRKKVAERYCRGSLLFVVFRIRNEIVTVEVFDYTTEEGYIYVAAEGTTKDTQDHESLGTNTE